jgi:phosphate transport system substrate-binding protein
MNRLSIVPALPLVAWAALAEAQTREAVRVASSAPTYDHALAVGEQYIKMAGAGTRNPVVTRMTTTQAIKLFCAGVGENHPDVAATSRRLRKPELETCAKNGVAAVTEIKYGYFGVVLAQNKTGPKYDLTPRDIYLALAKTVPEGNKEGGNLIPNPNRIWKQVNPNFPSAKIEFWGPPDGTGTRDGFIEQGLEAGCRPFAEAAKLDPAAFAATCRTIREDGVWNTSHEYEKVIIPALITNNSMIGIIGYGYYDEFADKLLAKKINGVEPNFNTVSSGDYVMGFPYFIYAKKAHLPLIRGLKDYVAEYSDTRAIGRRGYLVRLGLIPNQPVDQLSAREAGRNFPDLKL